MDEANKTSMRWDDGHGHLTEVRADLSPEEMETAKVLSRVLSPQSIKTILDEVDVRLDEATAAGLNEIHLHILARERDIYHMAQLNATQDQVPPAA